MTGGRVVLNTTLGVLLLVAGTIMLVTPGPGIVTIILGFAVLAREYTWAERIKFAILSRVKDASTRARARIAAHRAKHGTAPIPLHDDDHWADPGAAPRASGADGDDGTVTERAS